MIKILRIILGLALLAGLFFAGWRIYHRLPIEGSNPAPFSNSAAKSELNIVLRDGSSGETRIELYPIEYAAVQRDFRLNGRPGRSLEDYLALQLKNLPSVRIQTDQQGRAVARLSPDSKVSVGRETELWLDTDKLQFFDPETGRSLKAREAAPAAV